MATTEIDELVAARLKADATLAALGGRVWCDEAPARTQMPYAVVQLQGSTPSYESTVADGPAIEGDDEAELLVTLHAATRAEAKGLLRLAEASAVSGTYPGAVMYLRRSNRLVELAPMKLNGSDVWLGLLGLRAILELE